MTSDDEWSSADALYDDDISDDDDSEDVAESHQIGLPEGCCELSTPGSYNQTTVSSPEVQGNKLIIIF